MEVQLKSFDQVWSTIKNTHWDAELVGESWDAIGDKYRPQVESATSDNEVRDLLQAMINELGQSHFGVIPSKSYDAIDVAGGDGYCGIEIRLNQDNQALVTHVVAGSPAETAGVQPGWELLEVGDRKIADLTPKFEKAAHGPVRIETLAGLTLTRMADGITGKQKKLVFKSFEQDRQELELTMVEQPGVDAKFGNLPEMRIRFDRRTLEGGIGYFRFNAFFDPVRLMPAFRETVNDPDNANGLIIDLRGNIGGIAGMTMGMARPFVAEQTKLGVMTMKGAELKFVVFPNAEQFPGKVAVLVDECSVSSAEILSGGLQDLGVAKVFGRRTAGLALPSTVVKLPNGDGFQYAIADYVSESGKSLEMNGVTPDVEIPLDRQLLKQDSDPVMTAALKWLKQSDN